MEPVASLLSMAYVCFVAYLVLAKGAHIMRCMCCGRTITGIPRVKRTAILCSMLCINTYREWANMPEPKPKLRAFFMERNRS